MIDILFGIIQGVTEFLPISSSGHLVVLSELFKDNTLNTYEIAFLHLGTFFSILIYYFSDIFSIFRNRNALIQIFKLIFIGVMPAAAFGLFLPISDLIDESNAILVITALAYIFIASVLYFVDKLDEGDRSILDLSIKESLTIGFAQAIALFPGVSRSGITLSMALYLKLKKTEAIFFSLLLGLPTIFGAWLLTFIQASGPLNNSLWIPCIAAFLSGLVAIRVLIKFTVNSKLNVFSIYCFLMGLVSLGTYLINL
jgi:undecaprenyl-diphosphatase